MWRWFVRIVVEARKRMLSKLSRSLGACPKECHSGEQHNDFYCDDCVPRGCSCNMEPVDGNPENLAEDNWVEPVDDKGRKYPCCEYSYIGNED